MIFSIVHYELFYYIGLSLLLFVLMVQLSVCQNGEPIPQITLRIMELLFLSFVILYIGLRSPTANGDTKAYSKAFNTITSANLINANDVGFLWFMKLMYPFGIRLFYLAAAAIYVLLPYFTFRKWFGHYAVFASIVTIVTMSFFAFGTNTMRNGLAVAFFIFGLGFFQSNKLLFVLFLCVSYTFHSSMLLPALALTVAYFIRDSRILIGIWVVIAVLAYFFGNSIEQNITSFFEVVGFDDSRTNNLFTDEYKAFLIRRYRLDFVLYSAIPIVVGAYYQYKKKYNDNLYLWIYNTYIIANTYWLLMIYAAYTDRTAYLSWMLMPTVLVYPVLKKWIFVNQYRYLAGLILISFIFTLIIAFK